MSKRGWNAARAIKAILAFQLGIAAVLFGRDIAASLPTLGFAPAKPTLTGPVRPGDQTRRYDPGALPAMPGSPSSEDMPARLRLDPIGVTGLRLTGQIASGDGQRLADWLSTHTAPDTVALNSTGGSVADALAIGRALRDAGAVTAVGPGDICLSACPYMLAGGAERRVDRQAMVGVHQHFFGESTVLPAFVAVEDIQFGQAEVMEYLDAMGIDPLLMRHSLATPADEIYILVPDELTRYRLATEIAPG